MRLFVDRAPRRPRPASSSTTRTRAGGRRDLPPPRRHAAGDRAGGGAGRRAHAGPDRRAPRRPLDLLSAGSRTALTRQQTLRATLDWSYDLLDADEQVLLRRLAVFAGGFGLEAAEDVCAERAAAPQRGRRPARPAGRQVAGPRRGRGRRPPLPAAGDRPPVRGRAARARRASARRSSAATATGTSRCAESDPTPAGDLPARDCAAAAGPEHDNLRAALASALRRRPAGGAAARRRASGASG